jgi:DNA-binding response OmpR family regulator
MRVLVVEDEATIADFLVRGLTEQGYAVDHVADGQAALDILASASFDAVVLDILLPKLDGLTVCGRMRERGDHTPVLMLTARDTVDDRVRGLDSGADDYLVKPFAFAELVARIRALSRREPTATNPVLRVGDLQLDTTTRLASRGSRTIELTTKEYALLEYLMRNPNRVLTRTMITERVWNYDTFNVANVIDVYIGHLRRKIDDGHASKLIHTVRGAGYKIAASDVSATGG